MSYFWCDRFVLIRSWSSISWNPLDHFCARWIQACKVCHISSMEFLTIRMWNCHNISLFSLALLSKKQFNWENCRRSTYLTAIELCTVQLKKMNLWLLLLFFQMKKTNWSFFNFILIFSLMHGCLRFLLVNHHWTYHIIDEVLHDPQDPASNKKLIDGTYLTLQLIDYLLCAHGWVSSTHHLEDHFSCVHFLSCISVLMNKACLASRMQVHPLIHKETGSSFTNSGVFFTENFVRN